MKNNNRKTKEPKVADEFDLQNMEGIGPAKATKMINAGISNLYDIVVETAMSLKDKTGWDLEECDKIITKAREVLEIGGYVHKSIRTAKQVLLDRQGLLKLKTGSTKLDAFMAGGLEQGSMYEIYGAFSSGKTQFCHTMAVRATIPVDKGGLDGGVLWIDTENTFRPERVSTIASALGLEPEPVLEKIIVARAHNSSHQMVIVEDSKDIIREHKIKLIIVDSIVGNFRPEYVGRGTLAEKQQQLNRHLHKILHLAENLKCLAIVTNQQVGNPEGGFGPAPPQDKAAGGNVMAHASTHRIRFNKGKKDVRFARMVDSPEHEDTTVPFTIGAAGVGDAKEED